MNEKKKIKNYHALIDLYSNSAKINNFYQLQSEMMMITGVTEREIH